MVAGEPVGYHYQTAVGFCGDFRDYSPEMVGVLDRRVNSLDHQRGRRGFNLSEEFFAVRCSFRIIDCCDACDGGRDFFENFDPFASHRKLEISEAGDVTSWAS